MKYIKIIYDNFILKSIRTQPINCNSVVVGFCCFFFFLLWCVNVHILCGKGNTKAKQISHILACQINIIIMHFMFIYWFLLQEISFTAKKKKKKQSVFSFLRCLFILCTKMKQQQQQKVFCVKAMAFFVFNFHLCWRKWLFAGKKITKTAKPTYYFSNSWSATINVCMWYRWRYCDYYVCAFNLLHKTEQN